MILKIISREDVPNNFLANSDFNLSKFNLWPCNENELSSDYWLSNSNDVGNIIIGYYENNGLLGILLFNSLAYDSSLFGINCGGVKNIIVRKDIKVEKKKEVLHSLFHFLQDYRKQQGIKFCSIDCNNWDSDLMSIIQDFGFKYILTWGDCFYNTSKKALWPSNDYTVRKCIDSSELSYFKEMTEDYFKGGRFFMDKNFSKGKAQKLYSDLVINSFNDTSFDYLTLYKKNVPIGCFLCKEISYPFGNGFKVRSLRLLIFNKKASVKGVATNFLIETSNILSEYCDIVVSGIEMHNLPSMKIHIDAGFKFNNVHSVYHSWL